MKQGGKDISKMMMSRMISKIKKESWGKFHFQKFHIGNSMFENKIQFDFEKKGYKFRFIVYTIFFGEGSLKNIVMDIEGYESYEIENEDIRFRELMKETTVFKKLYRMIKEEIECTLKEDPELRMKYLFQNKEMVRNSTNLQWLLNEIERG